MSGPAPKASFRPRPTYLSKVSDALAKWVITAGGILIIISVIGIVVFILLETLPLFAGASARLATRLGPAGPEPSLAAGTDEYRDLLYEVTPGGKVIVRKLPGGDTLESLDVPGAGSGSLTSARIATQGGVVAWGGEDGRVGLIQVMFRTTFLPGGGRESEPSIRERATLDLETGGGAILKVAGGRDEDGVVTLAGITAGGVLKVAVHDPDEEETWLQNLSETLGGEASAVAVAEDGSLIVAASRTGEVILWENVPGEEPRFLDRTGVTASREVPVRSLSFLLGDKSFVVGAEDGGISVWSQVRDQEGGGWRLQELRAFPPLDAPVTVLAASPRDKGFLSGDDTGRVQLQYSTSLRTMAELDFEAEPKAVLISPRADGALVLGENGRTALWELENPHPEVSWKTLFGKVWYEGLSEPAFVWQSTGVSDDFESKMSLVPLLFGTIKGALYAMLFSVPISVLGAVYTSMFAHPRVKNSVKPLVEIMAALPSVIIGFLAGLWLAPLLASVIPHVMLMMLLIPILVLGASLTWEALPGTVRTRLPLGSELYLIMGTAFFGAAIAFSLGSGFENLAFGGDFPQWVVETLHLRFDPRNSLVVGFALGFAVIPIIFTIAEDAMATVPRHLVTASLALGASRWATAWRIVVPTASAGIFSAIMLGFGRAVGETMIVLMATGNTPILDWNPFVGMRTLSANIAVEIPEAPHGGTLYRVLFLSAALLFLLTFMTNTLAEVVSHRLRQRYKRL